MSIQIVSFNPESGRRGTEVTITLTEMPVVTNDQNTHVYLGEEERCCPSIACMNTNERSAQTLTVHS